MKTTQLRDYSIKPGQLDEFAELWNKTVRPLRQKKGFIIESAWKIPSESRFVWIVSHEREEPSVVQRFGSFDKLSRTDHSR